MGKKTSRRDCMHRASNGLKISSSVVVVGFMILLTAVMPVEAIEVHSVIANVLMPQITWDNSSFSGFYYDIDRNLGAETITFRPTSSTPTGATLSDQTDANNNIRGVFYETKAQLKKFKYKAWGQYDVVGFLGDLYFAAYDPTVTLDIVNAGETVALLYDVSKNRNLMTNEQISKILIDKKNETLFNSSSPLKLKEGYELFLKSINVNETKAIIELRKNGQSVDTKIIQPSSTTDDRTYYYTKDLGDAKGIVIIAVNFKNVFHGADKDRAAIDGIFQISDTPTSLKSEQQYDKMSIRNVDATGMTITMDNKDNQITLSKNKDIPLMGKIHLRTADQDGTADAPLRYYIYSEEPCSPE
jgi:S-layer protein (TIGR01567 family)